MRGNRLPKSFETNVLAELERLSGQKLLASTARASKIKKQRPTDFLKGRKPLTEYYVEKLMKGGAVTGKTFLGKRQFSELSEEEQIEYYKFVRLGDSTILKMIRAERMGIDVDKVLDSVIPSTENGDKKA